MLALRPNLTEALRRAEATSATADGSWLQCPPAGTPVLRRRVDLPTDADLGRLARALFRWDVHRAAGLGVCAGGDVGVGVSVVLGARVGPLAVVAPCRVVDVIDDVECVGFCYATLPGHPERGVEQFLALRGSHGPTFEVTAVSKPAAFVSSVAPPITRSVQSLITRRYLHAARLIATRP